MSVHGHGGHTQRETQNDAGRLGANAGQLAQPGAGFGHGHLGKEREIQRTVVEFQDAVEDGFDARGLDLGQAAAGDGCLNVVHVGGGDGLQRAEAFHQAAEGALGIAVGGVLGQDGKSQFVGRVQTRLVGKRAVFVRQQADLASEMVTPGFLARRERRAVAALRGGIALRLMDVLMDVGMKHAGILAHSRIPSAGGGHGALLAAGRRGRVWLHYTRRQPAPLITRLMAQGNRPIDLHTRHSCESRNPSASW